MGNFHYNSGSSNTLLGYVRAGMTLGHDVRISEFGFIDEIIKATIPVADRNWKPDLLAILYESFPFLSSEDLEEIRKNISRTKTIIIDPDGKYMEPYFRSGDTNHPTPDSFNNWKSLYDSLSDSILQPFLGLQTNKKVKPFLFFGIDNNIPISNVKQKDFDLIYVGNNWYRWPEMCSLIKIIAPIRSRLKRLALFGQYWSSKVMEDYETVTYSNPTFLMKNKVSVYDSIPYGQVEETMSRGLLNPILIRPIFSEIGFITPRMFETFAADTVPVISKNVMTALKLYGREASQLILSDDPANDILRILDNYKTYQKLAGNIRSVLQKNHSYEVRLNQLINYI